MLCLQLRGQVLLLTLGAHAQEGYCSCLVCVRVCLSVTTLAATSFVFTLKSRYVGVFNRLFGSIGIYGPTRTIVRLCFNYAYCALVL